MFKFLYFYKGVDFMRVQYDDIDNILLKHPFLEDFGVCFSLDDVLKYTKVNYEC